MYITKTINVDVDIDFHDLGLSDIKHMMADEGYIITRCGNFLDDELDYLIEMIDKRPESMYTRNIRDKLYELRFIDHKG